MTLCERLSEYVRACFTGLWVESHEHDDALAEIAGLCRQESWRLAVWDIDRGLQVHGQDTADAAGSDPLAAVRSLGTLATPNSSAILVLVNFHRFLNSAEIVQALARQISAGKQQRTFVVILAPIVQIPVELEKLFVVIEHELPSREQLEEIARGIATEEGELPDDALAAVLDSAAGLTRYEAEGAFSLSLVRHSRLVSRAIFEQKSQMLKKSGLLSLHQGSETFADPPYRIQTCVLELKEDREIYLVDPGLWPLLAGEPTFGPRAIFTAVNRQDVLFLWQVRLPRPDGKIDQWNASALEAVKMAETEWVRVSANMSLGAYDVCPAKVPLPPPNWPDVTFTELLRTAFKGRYIDSID